MSLTIVSKNKRVVCQTKIPYSADIIRDMKKAGYTVKIVSEDKDAKNRK